MDKTAEAKIVINDLSMAFPDDRKSSQQKAGQAPLVRVLEGINLKVFDGEFICIVGPSGCGKSTLLNVIGGFAKATQGEVRIDDAPVDGPNRKRIYIFQENGVFPWLTVEGNIGFGLLDRPSEERQSIVDHYIDLVGLRGFEKSYPRNISGGMKQRVELARALAANPDILYMDEAFGALDFLTRFRMRSELTQIWQREKKTVLFVTHDIEEAVQLADRVVIMSRRPSTITSIIDVKLPRPRDLNSPEYCSIRDDIFEIMGLNHSGIDSDSRSADEPETAVSNGNTMRPLHPKKLDADVIIIGGGPAGSVLASYLARAGINHILTDKAHHPRAQVGESLSCSAMPIMREIGFLPTMEKENFITKRGMSWISWNDEEQIDLEFQDVGDFNHAYQVDRAKFDDLLLRHAREHGTRTFSGGKVQRVDFDRNGHARGATVKIGESRFPLKCRMIVDATGRESLLGHQLRLQRLDPTCLQFAVHSWFTNVNRGKPETAGYTSIYLLPLMRGWAWQIPINEEVTSVGIVADRTHFVRSGEDVDQYFKWATGLNPMLAERIGQAERLREYRMDGNYSYCMDKLAGDGWMLIGDAAYFVDPIFSLGVAEAMHSAKFAAEAITGALAADDFSQSMLSIYEQRMRERIGIWQNFVRLFYEMAPIFSRVMAHSQYRTQMLQLCEGYIPESSADQVIADLWNTIEIIKVSPENPLNDLLVKGTELRS